ncbi:hypothetical protein ACRS5S_02650 [Nocardia asiatica]|uniref:hypothetical protein n=1 Tax=Nocardia asiatica TaxID=209252 RepID=UPI003EDF0DD9
MSMHAGEVSAQEVTRMISRGGTLTSLGQAIAHYGRISVLHWMKARKHGFALAAVRELRASATDEELADFETDVR